MRNEEVMDQKTGWLRRRPIRVGVHPHRSNRTATSAGEDESGSERISV